MSMCSKIAGYHEKGLICEIFVGIASDTYGFASINTLFHEAVLRSL